jgi:hypothetical protein
MAPMVPSTARLTRRARTASRSEAAPKACSTSVSGISVAAAPQLVFGEGLVAPEQAARPTALLPLAGGGAQLVAQARRLGVFAAPVEQARPGRQQGLVHDLDAIAGATAVGCRQQARADEGLERGVGVEVGRDGGVADPGGASRAAGSARRA